MSIVFFPYEGRNTREKDIIRIKCERNYGLTIGIWKDRSALDELRKCFGYAPEDMMLSIRHLDRYKE
ncbi:MAG: hypothetical protein LUG83_11480 [Lachnospiraceae bacterium]|nr:hypothetical protein [Lachnospiraceae bacterium]